MAIKQQVHPKRTRRSSAIPKRSISTFAPRANSRQGHPARRDQYSGGVHEGSRADATESGLRRSRGKSFPKDKTLVVGCMAGGRSQRACEMLEDAGYADLTNVVGGFGGQRDASGTVVVPGWSDAGLPVTTDLGDAAYEAQSAKGGTSDGDSAQPNLHAHRRQGHDRAGRRQARAEGERAARGLRHDRRAQFDHWNRAHLSCRNYRDGFGADFEPYSESLRRIQNELFDVGSELATPPDGEYQEMHRMGARRDQAARRRDGPRWRKSSSR